MKGLFKRAGILLGVLVLLVIAASIVVMFLVDKEMIAGQMESALNRHVTIDALDIGLFSVVSGAEVAGVKISNYKTPEQLKALKGKPVAENDLFAGLKRLTLKPRFLPLLSGSVQVGEFVIYEPVIRVVKYKNGTFNFSDLLQPEGEEKKQETKPSEPLSADDLPLSITLGKVGLEQGTVTYLDMNVNQTIQIYDLTMLAHSADIDPSNLEARNQVKILFELGVKPKDRLKSGAVKSFDVRLAAEGSVKPFDVKTRKLDPEVALEVASPKGTLSGVKILESIQSVKAIEQYTGKLSFLQDEVTWDKANMDVWYKAGNAKVSTGRIAARDCTLDFSGSTNIDTKAIDLDLGMELGKEPSQALRASIDKKMQNELTGDVAKYVSSEQLTDMVMKRLTNENGNVYLKYNVTGTTTSPKPTLVEPTVPSLQALMKEMGVNVADIAKEAAKKEAEKAIDDATKNLGDDLMKKLKF
jgi:uncharacterized protein involved in outer membrane biogenesis